jgi:hypothetical protein
MWKAFKNVSIEVKVAIIGGVFAVLATVIGGIIGGVFLLRSTSANQPTPAPSPTIVQSSTVQPLPSPTQSQTTVSTTSQPSTTIVSASSCPYTTSKVYDDNLRNIPLNVTVPQGCYIIISIYNGSYTTPDPIGIPGGSLLAYRGPVTIGAFLSGGGGGLIGFSNEADAKAFYCKALHSGNVYGIRKTPNSLDWASTC